MRTAFGFQTDGAVGCAIVIGMEKKRRKEE